MFTRTVPPDPVTGCVSRTFEPQSREISSRVTTVSTEPAPMTRMVPPSNETGTACLTRVGTEVSSGLRPKLSQTKAP